MQTELYFVAARHWTVPEVGSRNDAVLRTVMKGWLLSGAAHTCSEIKLWVKVVIDCK